MQNEMNMMETGNEQQNKMANGSNMLKLNSDEFSEIEDGAEVEVSVRGIKHTMEGVPHLQITEVDGVPVEAGDEAESIEPRTEMMNRMKNAGYLKGGDQIV